MLLSGASFWLQELSFQHDSRYDVLIRNEDQWELFYVSLLDKVDMAIIGVTTIQVLWINLPRV